MVSIITLPRQLIQPSVVRTEVNFSNPLATGLVSLVSTAGIKAIDAFNTLGASAAYGTVSSAVTNYGAGIDTSAANDAVEIATVQPALLSGFSRATIWVAVRRAGAGTIDGNIFSLTHSSNSDVIPYSQLNLKHGSNSSRALFGFNYNNTYGSTDVTTTFVANDHEFWVGTFASGNQTLRLFRNYANSFVSSTATFSGTVQAGTSPRLVIGEDYRLQSRRSNITFLAGGIYNRVLPLGEIVLLSRTYWDLFEPVCDRTFFLVYGDAEAGTISVSLSGAIQARSNTEAETVRTASSIGAQRSAGSSTATAIRTSAVAGAVAAKGATTATTLRSAALIGAATARGTISATVVTAGITSVSCVGAVAPRGAISATTLRSVALAGRTTSAGSSTATTLRTGLAAGRVNARGVVDAAAVAPGVTAVSVVGQIVARGSSAATTLRSVALTGDAAVYGICASSSIREGLATGRIAARGAVAISSGGALTPAASRTWLVPFEDRTLYVYQDNQ